MLFKPNLLLWIIMIESIYSGILNYFKRMNSLLSFVFASSRETHPGLLHHFLKMMGCLLVLASIHHLCLLVHSQPHATECVSLTEYLFCETFFCDVFSSSSLQALSLLCISFSAVSFVTFEPPTQGFHFLPQEAVAVHLFRNLHRASLPRGPPSCLNISSGMSSSHSHRKLASGFDPLQILRQSHIYSMHQQIPLASLALHRFASFSPLVRSF